MTAVFTLLYLVQVFILPGAVVESSSVCSIIVSSAGVLCIMDSGIILFLPCPHALLLLLHLSLSALLSVHQPHCTIVG